jgi:hypothetical protein
MATLAKVAKVRIGGIHRNRVTAGDIAAGVGPARSWPARRRWHLTAALASGYPKGRILASPAMVQ